MEKDELGIIIYERNESGLITKGVSTVALPDTANKFAVGCELLGNDGKNYTNQGSIAVPVWQDINSITTSEIASDAVTLSKLADGIEPSHIVKFFKLGSTITTTALAGLAIGDLVVSVLADGTSTVEPVTVVNTLPSDPADTSYLIVFRAVA